MKKLQTIANDIFLIEDFLSEKECLQFIECAESMGFSVADIDTGEGKEVISYIRNNERVDLKSNELAEDLWSKLSGIQLPVFDHMKAIGLSPFFRFYKYLPGHKFNMHKDGQQQVGENTTYYTFMVYLNDGGEGGNTTFRLNDISIKPKIGSLLLFEHRLWHQGEEVISGCKYVLRTDVMYENISFETYMERDKEIKNLESK